MVYQIWEGIQDLNDIFRLDWLSVFGAARDAFDRRWLPDSLGMWQKSGL